MALVLLAVENELRVVGEVLVAELTVVAGLVLAVDVAETVLVLDVTLLLLAFLLLGAVEVQPVLQLEGLLVVVLPVLAAPVLVMALGEHQLKFGHICEVVTIVLYYADNVIVSAFAKGVLVRR